MVPRKFVYKYHYLLITCLPVAMEQLEAVAVFRDQLLKLTSEICNHYFNFQLTEIGADPKVGF